VFKRILARTEAKAEAVRHALPSPVVVGCLMVGLVFYV